MTILGESPTPLPRHDVHSPDLYIPCMGIFTWVLLCCLKAVSLGVFSTDVMYARVRAGWGVWGG